MPWLLLGLIACVGLWWAMKAYATADPKKLVKVVRRGGALLAFVTAALLLFRGRMDMAMLLAGVGVWLFGLGTALLPAWLQKGIWLGDKLRKPARTSRVRSAMFELELDLETGAMRGQVLAGAFAGRSLDELTREDLGRLAGEAAADPDSSRLLEAYLDRRFPGWRQDAQRDPDGGAAAGRWRGAMTEQEAYQVLGLEPGADEEAIRVAHRSLMKRLHPDQGGSNFLAARVNEAKDVLLKRHG